MAMNYIETEIDRFFSDWFTCEKINLSGNIHTIFNDGVNDSPYIFYQYDLKEFPFNYHNMVVIDVINNCIVKNSDKITEDERTILHQFIIDNQVCLIKYWNTYNTDELCENITL